MCLLSKFLAYWACYTIMCFSEAQQTIVMVVSERYLGAALGPLLENSSGHIEINLLEGKAIVTRKCSKTVASSKS